MHSESKTPFLDQLAGKHRWLLPALLLALLALGLGIRLYDLTDPPMDFNPTRQLRGAIMARGYYYEMLPEAEPTQRDLAVSMARRMVEFEPPILEWLMAGVYLLLGAEHFWVARIVNSLIWLAGGWTLYRLAVRYVSAEAALVALGFYLFLPFSVYASRSFQPDPLMTVLTILVVYCAVRWTEEPAWKWVLLTGLCGGLAALVKVVAAYFIGGVMLALVLGTLGLWKALKDKQVWAMLALMVAPGTVYYLGVLGERSSNYYSNWGTSLLSLIAQPVFYFQWLDRLDDLVSPVLLFAALLGVLLSQPRLRLALIGWWAGYFIYGLTLPRHIITHDYYSIQLIPLVAFSLLPLAEALFQAALRQGKLWQAGVLGLLVFAMVFSLWTARSRLLGEDFRAEAQYWQALGEKLPANTNVIGLTQHYGHPLAYFGWRRVDLWPVTQQLRVAEIRGTIKDFDELFRARTKNNQLFLVTSSNQLAQQKLLKETLADYPLYLEGGGYTVYDLREKP